MIKIYGVSSSDGYVLSVCRAVAFLSQDYSGSDSRTYNCKRQTHQRFAVVMSLLGCIAVVKFLFAILGSWGFVLFSCTLGVV